MRHDHGMRQEYAIVFALLAVTAVIAAEETPRDIQDDRDRYNQRQRDDAAKSAISPASPMGTTTAVQAADAREHDRDQHQAAVDASDQAAIDRVQANNDAIAAQQAKEAAAEKAYYRAHPYGEESDESRQARLGEEAEQAQIALDHATPGSDAALTALTTLNQDVKQGSRAADVILGGVLSEGPFASDPARGRTLLRRALFEELMPATNALVPYARCFELGLGGDRDEPQARALYFAAIAKGTSNAAVAMRRLAAMDEEGRGAKADVAAAISWYRKAADRDDAPSRLRLAEMQCDGIGMPADRAAARVAFAALAGNADPDVASRAKARLAALGAP